MKSKTIDTAILILLFNVQLDLSIDTFRALFGKSYAHLWEQFSESYNFNLLGFFSHLDYNNKEKLCKYINDEIR